MKLVAKIFLAAIAYCVGVVVSGMLTPILHFPQFRPLPGTNTQTMFLYMLLATPLLAAGLLPLASGLRGKWATRWLSIAALMFVALGLNTVLELLIFSNMVDGQNVGLSLQYILPCVMAAAVLTYPLSAAVNSPATAMHFGALGWGWRLVVAWLSFPVIYFVFGVMVAPIVVPVYHAGVAGLRIPPIDVIMRMQLLRSALFLAASLPTILLWKKSRVQLLISLGLAHAMTVGIFGLVQASFLPTVLRVTHSVEIAADSFAYAAVLTYLFTRPVKAAQPALSKTSAAA